MCLVASFSIDSLAALGMMVITEAPIFGANGTQIKLFIDLEISKKLPILLPLARLEPDGTTATHLL